MHPDSLLVQKGLFQDLDEPGTRVRFLLGGRLDLVLLQLGLQLHLLLDPLGLLGRVRNGRVDQRSDRRREVGRLDPQSLGQSVDLGLNVGIPVDYLALADGGLSRGFSSGLLCRSKYRCTRIKGINRGASEENDGLPQRRPNNSRR